MWRRVRSAFALLLVSGLLAGCGAGANGLLSNGIGTDIDADGAATRAEVLEQYYGLMCTRAGASFSRTGEDRVRWNYQNLTPEDWRNIVRAGMNDVDERCDHYIESLRGAERDRDALSSQLTKTQGSTNTILSINQGVLRRITKKTTDIVAQAFGLARDTSSNYYERLILTVN